MAKKKNQSLSQALAKTAQGVTKTVANDKSASADQRAQARRDYRTASRIAKGSSTSKSSDPRERTNFINNSRLQRNNSSSQSTSASNNRAGTNTQARMNRIGGESANRRNASSRSISEIAQQNTRKGSETARTYGELQEKAKDKKITDTALGKELEKVKDTKFGSAMKRAGLTAQGTAKEVLGSNLTTMAAIRDPNEERMKASDKIREQRGEQVKGNKYEGAYDKLRNQLRDNEEQRTKDMQKASELLDSAQEDKERAKKGLGKVGSTALDVESAFLGMVGDATVGAATGTGEIGALGSMAVRSFGGAYNSAKKEGASDSQAAKYGAAVGGMEVLSEKMFNVGKAFKSVFGSGYGDELIEAAAAKGAEKLASKFTSKGMKDVALHGTNYIASAMTEGLEEVATGVADPFVANAIYARAVGNPHSFDPGQTFSDFIVGAVLGGMGGGVSEASKYRQGAQVKNVLGPDGLKDVADRVALADEDSGASDSARAIGQMVLNGEEVANAQALQLYKAAEQQEQKNFNNFKDSMNGAQSIIERDNLLSPSGLQMDESGQFVPTIGDNTNIKFQEARIEAQSQLGALQLKENVPQALGDAVASIQTGIGGVEDVEALIKYPEARAVYEAVTGESLPVSRKAMREYLYKKNAENRVQSAREETDFWKDQAVGLLSQTETEEVGGNGQAAFTSAVESLDVQDLGSNGLTAVRTTFNDYYQSAQLGIPMSVVNDIAKPEYDLVPESVKQQAYNAGILDANGIMQQLDGVAVQRGKDIKEAAKDANKNGTPGKLYIDADDAARKYFTGSQQKMWKALAEEFGVGIHILDAEAFAAELRSRGQEVSENAEELPNGFYKDGEIYLNAETPDRALRYVFAHELTHHLQQVAPEEYNELRNRMVDELLKDESLEKRIANKQRQYGGKLSATDALDEILADSTYEFLNDDEFIDNVAKDRQSLAQAVVDAIRNVLKKIRAMLARDEYTPTQNANMYAQLDVLKDMEALWMDAINVAKENAVATDLIRDNGEIQYSINEKFYKKLDSWDGETTGFSFEVGKTSDVLKMIGVKPSAIRIHASKIKTIIKEHEGMDKEVIKQLPNVLEDPIIVMQSKSAEHSSRIVMLGEVYDKKGKPVTVVLELLPKSKKGNALDVVLIATAQGRKSTQSLINGSTFLYVNPQKNKTNNWLSVNRLQLPLRSSQFGLINKITYSNGTVNVVPANDNAGRFSMKDSTGETVNDNMLEFMKNSKIRDKNGALYRMYHGTMNAGFTVFDKGRANPEGNSGAGFYFSNVKADSEENYSDRNGADNVTKIDFLADQILEMGEWNGKEVEDYDEARDIAIEELEQNPGMYEVYLNVTKPYVRDSNNSTNLYDDLMAEVDDSLVDPDDYEDEDDYYDDLYNSRSEQIYEMIDRAFYSAMDAVESRFGEVDFYGSYSDVTEDLVQKATGLENLNWDDLVDVFEEYEMFIYDEEMDRSTSVTHEVARQFVEEFGYDGIIDREVSQKFGQMKAMKGLEKSDTDAMHVIVFNPEQAKLTINENPTSNPDIRYSLKNKDKDLIEDAGVTQTKNGSAVRYSVKSWEATDKKKLTNALKKAGYQTREIEKWINDVNTVSAIVAADRTRLDYRAADNQTMLKKNNDYYRTLDASTLCAKRILYQGTYNAIQKALPNTPLLVDDVVRIRQMLDEHGLESPCGICYVESRRKTLGKYSSEWLDSYKGEYIPTLADVTTTDGLEALRHDHPQTYEDYMKAMRKKGVANPKVVELRTDYRGEIASLGASTIEKIKHIGGLRVQSFSDFETPHLIDMMQAVVDMAGKNLTAQAYTKVPNFAWTMGDTGIKINLSLIAKKDKDGKLIYDEDGKLMFDSKEGMPIEEALKLRERYPENVGTIVVGISDEHIRAAMADDRIDMIIPFHRSGWGKAEFEGLGLTGYDDYQAEQEEYLIHPYETGKMKNGKPEIQNKPEEGGYYSIDYWDYSKSGKENAETYLKMCAESERYPVFKSFLKDNGDGSFSLQDDGSTDGYWKMLIDFKMYDNDGKGAPQREVKPEFNMTECKRVLNEYEGGADTLPVADDVVSEFVEDYKKNHPDTAKFSQKDSTGRELSAQQQEYFKDSKVRDDEGNLMVLHHGSENAGFTVFAPEYSPSADEYGVPMTFLTDNKLVAKGYSGSYDSFDPYYMEKVKNVTSIEELRSLVPYYGFREEEGRVYAKGPWASYEADTLADLVSEMIDDEAIEEPSGSSNYELYANVTNPLVVDANNNHWDEINAEFDGKTYASTNEIAAYAYQKGYDGVIVKNVYDTAIYAASDERFIAATDVIVFNSNQIKDVDNSNPTDSEDIRYSMKETMLSNALKLAERDGDTAEAERLRAMLNSDRNADMDAEYMEAVKAGDMDKAQQMVRAAAEDAGYVIAAYHGTQEQFNEFDEKAINSGDGFWFSDEYETSHQYGSVRDMALDLGNSKFIDANYAAWDEIIVGDPSEVVVEIVPEMEDGRVVSIEVSYADGGSEEYEIDIDPEDYEAQAAWVEENIGHMDEVGINEVADILFQEGSDIYSGDLYNEYDYGRWDLVSSTNELTSQAKDEGYDSLEIANVEDGGSDENTDYIIFKANLIKSLDPVTYDDDGNIIPLSQRFQHTNNDVRYSQKELPVIDKEAVIKYIQDHPEEFNIKTLDERDGRVRSYEWNTVIELEQQVASLKQRQRLTKGKILEEKSVRSDINEMIKALLTYSADGKKTNNKLVSETVEECKKIWAAIQNNNFESAAAHAFNQADKVVKTVLTDSDFLSMDEEGQKDYMSTEEWNTLVKDTAMDIMHITATGRAYRSMADKYEDRLKAARQRATEAKRDAVKAERAKGEAKLAEEKQKRKDSEAKLRADRDAKVQAEKEKRSAADQKRKNAAQRRKSMKRLNEDYKWLSDRILKPTDDKHVPDRMVKPLAELLQYIDLETEYSKKFEAKTGQPTMAAVNLRDLRAALEDVSKSAEARWILEDEDLIQMIEELQTRIGDAPIYELDNSELDAVQALLHAIKVDVANANKAFVMDRAIDDTAKSVIWEANEYKANSKKRRDGGLYHKIIDESMVKPMEFFERLGPAMKSTYMAMRKGMDTQSNHMKEARKFFAEVFEGYGKKGKPGSTVQSWRGKKEEKEFTLESGERITLNPSQVMSLYCLSKREQALGHILGQGICASDPTEFTKIQSAIGTKEQHKQSTTMVTANDIKTIINSLSDEQIRMADKLQNYLNTTVAEWGNETSLLMYDRRKFTEENYFPIQSQDVYLDANFEKRNNNVESIKNFGFTKGTVVNANNPIVINDIFAVCAKHINQMMLYNAYAPAISDFTRVYNYRDVQDNHVEAVQAILADTYGGKIVDQYISKFMADLQNNTQTRRGGFERLANGLLANYKKAAIAASPRVALQQPTAIMRALSEIDLKYFAKMDHSPQLLQMATGQDNAYKEMMEHCPTAYWKSMGFNQVDMARDIEDIMMNMEWSRLDTLTMGVYGALDNYTWSKIWKAIKAEQKDKHPEVEYESDEFWELCNDRAIEVFDKTQVVDSVFHRSDVMRNKELYIKSITSFMAEPTTTFNMLRSNLMRANDLAAQGKHKEAWQLRAKTVEVYTANAMLCAMAAAIADAILKKDAGGDDDDKENKTFFDFWLANTIENFKGNENPLNMIPFAKDFSSYAEGWGASNMIQDGIAAMIKDGKAILDKATDPESKAAKKNWTELITQFAKDSSSVTGIPIKNILRYGAAACDLLGINVHAAEQGGEEDQKNIFGQVLSLTGFADKSAEGEGTTSEEPKYKESWLTEKLHEAGVTEGTTMDKVLDHFGLNKTVEEQEQEAYDQKLKEVLAAGEGYEGVDRDEKLYSKATYGYTKLVQEGNFEELENIRKILNDCDVDTAKFDKGIEAALKKGIKRQVGEKGDPELRNKLTNYLKETYGYSDEQFSREVLEKTDTAKEFQKLLCKDDYNGAVEQLRYLREAGLTYEDFVWLYEKRWSQVEAETTGTFAWPGSGRVSSGFGHRWGTLHAGMDIAMPVGSEVTASDGGEVVFVGYDSARGKYVDIKHDNGYVSRYQHLSWYDVEKGQKVAKGQYIAKSGNTGSSTGPHLHFAVYQSTSHTGCTHGTAVDPSKFLASNN